MKNLTKITLLGLGVALIASASAKAEKIMLSEDLVWQYSQYNDEQNRGRTTSSLTLGIPETDATAIFATCSVGSSGNFSKLYVTANVADKREGDAANVVFFNHSVEHRLDGSVVGPNTEEGSSGVELVIDNNDPVWDSLSNWFPIAYRTMDNEYVVGSNDTSNNIDKFIKDCRFYASAENQPTQKTPVAQNDEAGSWGGKVRSGPGMQFKQIGSLQNGDPIQLVENTGVMMNGYPWFRISFANGKDGYQWGGIICGYSAPIQGAADICDSDNRANGSGKPATSSVKGPNVSEVNFRDGSFIQDGNGQWSELGNDGTRRFSFVEQTRDEWSVYLRDDSRGVNIQLDLYRKKVIYSDDKGKKFDLYDVIGAFTGQH